MNRTALRLGLFAGSALMGVTVPAFADGPEFEPDRVFVRLQPGASIAAVNQIYGTTVNPGQSIPSRGMYLLDLPPGASESTFVSLLQNDSRIASADFNFYVIDEDPNGTTRRMYLSVPRWWYDQDAVPGIIAAPDAWVQSRGAGIVVAVIDTGVDSTHPLLARSVVPRGFNFLTNTANTLDVAQNVDTNGNGEIDQLFGHGTLVAGLVLRVAPDARIMPIVAMDSDGYATIFRLAQGLYHALDNGAHIANVSMGMEADPPLLRDVIADVESQGLIVVASAGNRANSNPDFPAGTSSLGTLAVAATTDNDVRAEFSNYGPWVSLSAPGVDVVSTVPGGGYGVASGTSLSAPLVAGAAASVRAICPLIPASQVDAIIRSRSVSINAQNPSYVNQLGSGRLNVAMAVGAVGAPLACDCDLNNDGLVTKEDLYRMVANPVDANGDGVANAIDTRDLVRWMRRTERTTLQAR
jgi:subtilisin family serine protease